MLHWNKRSSFRSVLLQQETSPINHSPSSTWPQCKVFGHFCWFPGVRAWLQGLKNSLKVIPSTWPFHPCLKEPICLITLFKEPLRGIVEARFNQHYTKAWSIIERASAEPLVGNISAFFDGLPHICHWRAAVTFVPDFFLKIYTTA